MHEKCLLKPLPIGWHTFFRHKDNASFRVWQTLRRGVDFCACFRRFKHKQSTVFFLESFNTSELFAFAVAALFFAKKKDTVALLFRYGKPQYPFGGKLHVWVMRWLKRLASCRVLPLTDSELIAKSFAPTLKLSVLPIPHTSTHANNTKKPPSFFMWWPGEPRNAKGSKEIHRLLKERASSPLQITCALSKKFNLNSQERKEGLYWLDDPLPRDEYEKMLAACDAVLLPYDPTVYAFGTSGIFVEAIVAGKIPFVKQGSFLAAELKKYALETLIIDWEQENILPILWQKGQDRDIKEKLLTMQQTYRAFHNPKNTASTLENMLLTRALG